MAKLYVPILKGKEGEFAALDELSTAVRDAILPLVEIPRVAYDYVEERPAKTAEDHVAAVSDRLQRTWTNRPLYLDVSWVDEIESIERRVTILLTLFAKCRASNVRAIPVVGTSASNEYIAALNEQIVGNGVCIRLTDADFDEEANSDSGPRIDRLLQTLSLTDLSGADVIVDLGDLGQDLGRATLAARAVIGELPRASEWRRVVVAGASFPENLADVDRATVTPLPRFEWTLWERLRRRSVLRKDALFGDYGIAHPVPTELDPRTMRMSASIRYTTDDSWLILKGRNVRQYGFDQYFELCRTLVALSEYSGESFSWGDLYIARCARNAAGPGNATIWRKVGTNHHITLVARALASFDAV